MEGKLPKNKLRKVSAPDPNEVKKQTEDVKKSLAQTDNKTERNTLSATTSSAVGSKISGEQKNISSSSSTEPILKTVKGNRKIPLNQQNRSKINSEKAKSLYEVKTMQHDLDLTKGKKVSTLSLTEATLSRTKAPQSKIEGIRSKSLISTDTTKIEDLPKEGSIGAPNQSAKIIKLSFWARLKNILQKRSEKKPKNQFKFVIVLIIIVFVGGAGYYIYTSGAFSSIEGIEDMFRGFFKKESPDEPVVPIMPATSTPLIPPSATTTLPPSSDNKPTLTYSASFFEPDEEKIIRIDKLEDLYLKLEESFENEIKEDIFRRIIILARDDFTNLSLAQVWKTIKKLALGDKYTELITAETIENWGLAMPSAVERKLSEDYNLFFYGQPDNGPRAVFISRIDNMTGINDEMFLWEESMKYDLKKLFLGTEYGEASSETYLDNIYKDITIRYLNLPESSLTIDYAVVPDKNYLILSTSRESIWATIDKILESNNPIKDENREKVDILSWDNYQSENHDITFSYPSNFVATSSILHEYPDGKAWSRIDLEDKVTTFDASFHIDINPDGYGPFFPDKVFNISEDSEGKLIILEIKTEESEYSASDGITHYITNLYESENGNNYSIQYNTKEDINNLEMFKAFLSNIQFTE